MFASFLVNVAFLFATLHAQSGPPIAITTSQVMGNSPLDLRVRITIQPDARNRWACLYATQFVGGSAQFSSCWELQAEKEAKTTWRTVKRLTGGKWEVAAAVIRQDSDSVLSNRQQIRVIGQGFEADPE